MKLTRKLLTITAIIAVIGLAVFACGGGGGDDKTLVSIQITPPTKTTYVIGETLNTDGMVVTATYSDGSTVVIANDKLTISPLDSATEGEKTITVSYGGKSVQFTVTVVIAPELVSIEITPPTKVRYNLGEDLDLAGMIVTATYSDDSTAVVTDYTTDTSAYDKNTVGHHKITVTYNGISEEFTVNVIDPTIPTVATPTASPAGFGLYTEVQTVTLTTTPSDARIYYTTDDTEPTEESTLYDGPITVDKSMRIRAFAVKEDYNDSDELNVTYTLQVTRPHASVPQGTYTAVFNVTLSVVTDGAAIYYTTDGTNPTASSTLYTGEISINTTTTLKVIGIKDGWSNSTVLTVEYTLRLPFTYAPVLELEPGNVKIIYTWTASEPVADSYDVYWKEGENLTAAAIKDGGTKITGATSGGTITGLTNNTAYSVIVTANKASYASKDSDVETAIPVALVYNITGSSSTFTATKNGVTVGTASQPIQTVIDAIKTDAAGRDCIIEFGNGETELDIGTASASFSGTGWGFVELSGKITGSSAVSAGTIVIADAVSITSIANIANTTNSASAMAINNNSTGTLTISGGTVQTTQNNTYAINNNTTGTVHISSGTVSVPTGRAVHNNSTGAVNISGGTVKVTGNGYAVYNASTGKITVSGTATVTSLSNTTGGGTIYLAAPTSDNTDPRLVIEGGTVENTATGANGRAVYNASTGAVNISGGTVQANTGVAAYNASTGIITVSGTAKVTSANATTSSGTINIASTTTTGGDRLVITGGTVENTASSTIARAVYNASTGAVNISGGSVSAIGYAVNNYSTGALNISGGTFSTQSGSAVLNTSTGSVTISGGTVQATATTGSSYAVRNSGAGTITITSGSFSVSENETAYAVYNESTGIVNISGGTFSATTGVAVYNNDTGSVNISGGTVKATTGRAVYNKVTGTITVSQATATPTLISSANTNVAQGTIHLAAPSSSDNTNQRLTITGGIVENTGTNGRVIYNASTGGVTISAGTVRAIGSGTVYSVYSDNVSPGALTMTIPPAVVVGRTYPPLFTVAPALTISPDSGKITYTWVASTPAADSYDVYWKAGNLSAIDIKSTGTKITNATSGGIINGTDGLTYSVVVTANLATSAGIDSVDSSALAAKPGTPIYTVTGSDGSFTATKTGGTTVGSTGSIQDVINAIRTDANGAVRVIQFGDGNTPLDTGTTAVSFNNTGGTWGQVELSGKITSAVSSTSSGTIVTADAVSLNSIADIKNTATTNGYGVYHNSTGTFIISGGTVSATTGRVVQNQVGGTITITSGTVLAATGCAVYNVSSGKITVSGTAQISSANTSTSQGTIYLTSNANALLEITGGTVQNTATHAVYIAGSGTVNISGGTVQSASGTGTPASVYNYSGTVNITGGTVKVTGNGYAVNNYGNSSGTVNISGGMVQSAGSTAVHNNSGGTVNISGGTVQSTNSLAVNNYSNGTVNISGGTVQSTTDRAVQNYSTGKITVSGTALVTSAYNTNNIQGTINIVDSGSSTAERLIITGGTIQNTSSVANGNAIYNNSTGAITMSSGTVSTTATEGRGIHNNNTGAFTMSGGTVSVTGASARAINNQSTGAVSITGGTVTAPVNATAYSIYNTDSNASVTVDPGVSITGARYP